MEIETIDDVIDMLADKLGVYGACKSESDDGCDCDNLMCCRVGFAMVIKDKIYTAIENENKLREAGLC